jgi:putative transposase
MKVYKFRLYPTLEQCAVLYKQFDLCRYTYNKLLEELSKNKDRKHIQHHILKLKRNNPVLNEVYSKTLQYECYRLFSNLKGLSQLKKKGNKVGKLRFKGRDWFKTIVYNQSGFKLVERQQRYNILQLSKIGKIRLLQHREIEGKIKGIIIKKKVGSWEAHIITDAVCNTQKGDSVIGIDLGVMSFLTDNNGNKVSNPLYLKESLGLLKKKQQELSRKKRGSHNRHKAKIQLAKLHEHITQQRTDFLHKLTTQLVKQNSFIAVEKLNIRSMQTSAYNSRNINDSSWGKFLQLLDYKAESAGCQVVKVDPNNTTKQCSHCGELQDMPLHIRQYDCPNCGMSMDRDKNSAINILKRALEQGTAEKDKVSSLKQEAITSTQGVRL